MKFCALPVILFVFNAFTVLAGTTVQLPPLPAFTQDAVPAVSKQSNNSTAPNSSATNNQASKAEHSSFIDLGENKLPVATGGSIKKGEKPKALLLGTQEKSKLEETGTAPSQPIAAKSATSQQPAVAPNTLPQPQLPMQSQTPQAAAVTGVQEGQHAVPAAISAPENTPKAIISNSKPGTELKPVPDASTVPSVQHVQGDSHAQHGKHKKPHANAVVALTPEQSSFASNEAKVLLLPNDDVVLGKVTQESRLEDMDIKEYLALFNKVQEQDRDAKKRKVLDKFLVDYGQNFKLKNPPDADELNYASSSAFEAAAKDNLFRLRALIDYYPILQVKDSAGNSLLQNAVINDNYALVKFLIIRGVNIYSVNNEHETAMDIAQNGQYEAISALLGRAKGSR